MNQGLNHVDYYEYNRQYSGIDENFEYKTKSVPQAYPVTPVPSLIPSMIQVPLMTMRPGAEMDYTRWLSGNYQPTFRNNFFDPHSFQRNPPNSLEHINTQDRRLFQEEVPDTSMEQQNSSMPNSPRYGPGPPIVTSDRVKGPRGCNLFVFHLPNEITNWYVYCKGYL